MTKIKLTLCLDIQNDGGTLQPVTKEVEWPVVPQKGDQLIVEGKGYDVITPVHNFDTGEIQIKCLSWDAGYRVRSGDAAT
jgi:hypothetical protein